MGEQRHAEKQKMHREMWSVVIHTSTLAMGVTRERSRKIFKDKMSESSSNELKHNNLHIWKHSKQLI